MPIRRRWIAIVAPVLAGWPLLGGAQIGGTGVLTPTAPVPSTAQASDSARFLASCNRALDSGRPDPACQDAAYRNELERLRADALRTQNSSLITLVGDAYSNARSPVAAPGEAYQWYLMAAVRGDPLAMERLADMYQTGRGVPRDRVKAFGYARATTRLAVPGSVAANQAERALAELGKQMNAQEIALAERFADQMQSNSRAAVSGSSAQPGRDSAGVPGAPAAPAADSTWTGPLISTVPRGVAAGGVLPGVGNLRVAPASAAAPATEAPRAGGLGSGLHGTTRIVPVMPAQMPTPAPVDAATEPPAGGASPTKP